MAVAEVEVGASATEAGAEAGDGEEATPHAAATPRPMTSFSARSTTRPLGQPMVWMSSTVPPANAAAAAGTLAATACRGGDGPSRVVSARQQ